MPLSQSSRNKQISASLVCVLLALSLGQVPAVSADNAAQQKRQKTAPKNQIRRPSDAATMFGEQLLLKMSEPPKQITPTQPKAQPAEKPSKGTHAQSHFLKALVVHNEVSDQLERVGIFVAVRIGDKPMLVINEVRLGSAAYYGGLTHGDMLKAIVQKKDSLVFIFERNGRIYSTQVPCPPGHELSQIAIKDFLSQAPKFLASQSKTKIAKPAVIRQSEPIQLVNPTPDPSESGKPGAEAKLAAFDFHFIIAIAQSGTD